MIPLELAEYRERQCRMAFCLAEIKQSVIRDLERVHQGGAPLSKDAELRLLLEQSVTILAVADEVEL